jgi:hypothetical protein
MNRQRIELAKQVVQPIARASPSSNDESAPLDRNVHHTSCIDSHFVRESFGNPKRQAVSPFLNPCVHRCIYNVESKPQRVKAPASQNPINDPSNVGSVAPI